HHMRFEQSPGLASNSAANSAAGPVLAPRIPLPAASPNFRQLSDLSMIITSRGRFSGRSEAFLPASREISVRLSRGAEQVSKRIDVAALPAMVGTLYPPPFDLPCRSRERTKLGDPGGLTQFGVNLCRLPPGAWSSQRHWHSHE